MAKEEVPKTLNQRSAQKLLEGLGYTRDKGSKHNVKMVKEGKPPITLPMHRKGDYGKGLTADILRQAGIKENAKEDKSDVQRHHQ